MRYGYTFMWVDDVQATVAFYAKAFDLRHTVLMENGTDGWYAELDSGQTTIAIADTREAHRIFAGLGVTGLSPDRTAGFQLTFVTDDVPSAYRTALAAGARPQAEPETMPWGQTIGRVQDPNGVLVSLATPRRS